KRRLPNYSKRGLLRRLGVQLLADASPIWDALLQSYMGDAMEKPAQNIQDSFLNNARKDKTAITLYLLSGVKLSGRIKSFDKYSLILETNNQEQLIFKHAISTVVIMKAGHAFAPSSQMAATSSAGANPP